MTTAASDEQGKSHDARVALDDLYEALLVVADDGRVIAANRRAALLSGFSTSDLCATTVMSLFGGLRREHLGDLKARITAGQFTVIETALRRKDGSREAVDIGIGRTVDGEGGFLFSMRRSNAEGGPGKAFHRQVFQGLYDAVMVSDLKGQIVDENRRAREAFGYGDQHLSDCRLEDLVSGLDQPVLHRIYRDLAGGRFTVLDAYCIRKDKTTFPSEIAMSAIRHGDSPHLVLAIRSTERRRRMQELLRTEHNALQNAASGIAITDNEGRVRFGNRSFLHLWGYAMLKEMAGKPIRDFWNEKETAAEMVAKAAAGNTWHGELSSVGLSGKTFYVQGSAAPNRDSRERTTGLVFSFIDVTERRRAEEAIRKEAAAQMKKAREQEEFSGMLNIVSIPDVVQLVDSTRKSGVLSIMDEAGAVVSTVSFSNGQVIAARCGSSAGEAAFHLALRRGGTAFLFRQGVTEEKDPTITQSTMGLLLDGTRVLDEEKNGGISEPAGMEAVKV